MQDLAVQMFWEFFVLFPFSFPIIQLLVAINCSWSIAIVNLSCRLVGQLLWLTAKPKQNPQNMYGLLNFVVKNI
jgi:membrane protein insertase Oxa1/YidC/SpoIIIJ